MNTKRPNYFTGQFLKADDFNTEQAYHIAALREHNKAQHTWGVAEGLDVTFKAGSPVAHVKEGTAIDADGKIIYLSAGGFDVDFSTITSNATTFYITIEYSEKGTDATSETGVTGNTRIEETPAIATSETLPTDQSRKLVLAQVALVVNADNSKSVDSVDTSVRKNSGVVAGDLEARSLSLSIDDTDKSLWPRLEGVKSGNETKLGVTISQSDFSGQLKVNGAVGIGVEPSTVAKLQVGGSLKVTGNVTNDQNLSIGGRLSVTGTSELSGGLSVTGDSKFTGSQSISSNLNVGGDIVVNGNVDVKGTTTTINTTEMEVSDNIIRVNKYSPQVIPKKVQGGLEVFRGGTEPEAQIVWDESSQKWMAGKSGALAEIPVGPLSVDANGNVTLNGSLSVTGRYHADAVQLHGVRYNAWGWSTNSTSWVQVQNLGHNFTIKNESVVIMSVNGHVHSADRNPWLYSSFFVDDKGVQPGGPDWGQYHTYAGATAGAWIPYSFTQMINVGKGSHTVSLRARVSSGTFHINGACIQTMIFPK